MVRLNPALRSLRGFTLLELLVVMVLIGIIATLAVLSGGLAGSQAKVLGEARRLAGLIELHCQEAVLFGRESGIRIEPEGYAFSWWDGEGWAPAESRVLRPRILPEGIQLALEPDQPARPDAPQLLCWSSGELTPFTLLLRDDAQRAYRVAGLASGRVEARGWIAHARG